MKKCIECKISRTVDVSGKCFSCYLLETLDGKSSCKCSQTDSTHICSNCSKYMKAYGVSTVPVSFINSNNEILK